MSQEQLTQDFLRGFAKATGMDVHEANVQWAAYSRGLDDADIAECEAGGYDSRVWEGESFRKTYPKEEQPDENQTH